MHSAKATPVLQMCINLWVYGLRADKNYREKKLQSAQIRKRKHIFLELNIRPSLRFWRVEILEGDGGGGSFSPFAVSPFRFYSYF